jgi:peptidyl-prolyl cis-trans isomerase A (cyclophilin A)
LEKSITVIESLICKRLTVLLTVLLLAFVGFTNQAKAGTLVRIGTSVGNYTIELFDDVAPATVQNFLGYVNRGDYDGTYIHRSELLFVVQGGGYRFQSFVGPIDVPPKAPVVNEFNVSNRRGTVAMAKIEGFPDSATTQWFINVADNSSSLDAQNGGFTAFGTVLGEGMAVVDRINQLPIVSLGIKASSAPYITPVYNSPSEFVYINAAVVDRFSAALHVYEQARGLLMISVNVNGDEELLGLNLKQSSGGNNPTFQVIRNSVIKLRDRYNEMATYSSTNNLLTIPELEVNIGGSAIVVRNVVLRLTDINNLLFTLVSYQP